MWYYIKLYNLCNNLFTWRVLSDKNVFLCRTTIIALSLLICHLDKLYHKLYYFMRDYHYSFCFHFFSYTRFAFLFSLITFFFLGTFVLSLGFNLLPLTDYSIESILSTHCSVSHEGDYLWITNSFEILNPMVYSVSLVKTPKTK